jgi:hypothetical protein
MESYTVTSYLFVGVKHQSINHIYSLNFNFMVFVVINKPEIWYSTAEKIGPISISLRSLEMIDSFTEDHGFDVC